ncbi:large subunit ribosomal protein L27e, cytoplasmic [Guillardia theta CCMP2712]|uniref:60S ribosomal protein L27 n=1 Tax=Guillardia theta (strain CCMP2712) TaxID=905079 RepID=L1JNU8_GUITC|nr:large subunit ribosomal protein L27e, cytoplasmic [Guillardia theta CCMP2712]EKX49850.1 large subunit ribosomal protein L27e, cytoplasmic [Guillardia theta CCMP2712]|eukprot:XP_005836830.1 large subunit ribosomal protein L27e, cytoplasmic [Guillardia theta CCMP2712]
MVKFLKQGKVVIVLNGRMAGKKGIIVKTFDDGTDGRKYGHAIVAGIDRAPLKVKKSMSEKKVQKRSRVKPFLKLVNFNHLMPTRYSVDVDFKPMGISPEVVTNPSKREEARKAIKQAFQERYTQGKNRWFFSKLRF